MIQAVVFDFDGVLADTERLHLLAFQDVFRRRGWTLDEDTYFNRYLHYGDGDLIAAFSRDRALGLELADRRELMAEKREAFWVRLGAEDVLYQGTRACVARLGSRFALAIASGSLHAEIVHILATGRVLNWFPIVVGADDVTSTKPHPELYVTAAARLGAEPSRCVAVEDTRGGLEAARAAGMRTIAITTTSTASRLSAADRLIASLDELTPDLIESLGATGQV